MKELEKILSDYIILSAYDIGDSWVAEITDEIDGEDTYDNFVIVNKTTKEIHGFSMIEDPRANTLSQKNLIYKR